MRIVGGRLRGRLLAAPTSQAIRPTADRLRESLFNILVHAYGDPITDARVLDLFAGTGALGLEALSRARHLLCSSTRERRPERCCARTWRPWGWAAPPASFGVMPPSSGRRIRSSRSPWLSSIRLTAAALPNRLSLRHEPVDGWRPARWWSWKRPRNPASRHLRDSTSSNAGVTTTARSSCCDTASDKLLLSPR